MFRLPTESPCVPITLSLLTQGAASVGGGGRDIHPDVTESAGSERRPPPPGHAVMMARWKL